MKRVVGDKEIYPHYTLFSWSECVSCNQEFRREKGWRKLSGPFYVGMVIGSMCVVGVPLQKRKHPSCSTNNLIFQIDLQLRNSPNEMEGRLLKSSLVAAPKSNGV